MILDFEPGDKVINPTNKDWGIGQVQSIIKDKITVNFQRNGKTILKSCNLRIHKTDRGTSQYQQGTQKSGHKKRGRK